MDVHLEGGAGAGGGLGGEHRARGLLPPPTDRNEYFAILQGGFFDWSPLKCLSMELVLAPQFRTGPPPTHNVIKFVKKLQYNT